MILDGARICFEGVKADHEYEEKIQQIVNAVKSISPSSEVSMRFLKNGNLYEGLLWGQMSNVPIGAYNRGQSMSLVLDSLYKKVKHQSRRVWKLKRPAQSYNRKPIQRNEPLVLAG